MFYESATKKGFISENIELIIAAIAVILITFGVLMSFFYVFRKERDLQRKADLRILQRAIEEYHNNFGRFPGEPNKIYEGRIPKWIPDLFLERRVSLPQDPKTGTYDYRYRHNGFDYEFDAYLEFQSDKDLIMDGGNNSTHFEIGTDLNILD